MTDAPPPAAPPAERSNEVQFGPWLSESFQRFGDQAGLWIGQGVIATVITTVPALIGIGFWLPGYIETLQKLESTPQAEQGELLLGLLTSYGYVFVGLVIQTFLLYYFLAGMVRTAARQLRGEPTSFADVFSGGGRPIPILVQSALLTFIHLCCGMATCYLATALFIGLWLFAIPLVTERGQGALEALGNSWRTVSDRWLHYFAWALLLGLFLVIGQSVCWIGTVVALPVIALAIAIGYRDVIGMEGAEGPAKPAPPPLPTGME